MSILLSAAFIWVFFCFFFIVPSKPQQNPNKLILNQDDSEYLIQSANRYYITPSRHQGGPSVVSYQRLQHLITLCQKKKKSTEKSFEELQWYTSTITWCIPLNYKYIHKHTHITVFCEIISKALTACNSAASSATVTLGSVNWTDGIWAWMVRLGAGRL